MTKEAITNLSLKTRVKILDISSKKELYKKTHGIYRIFMILANGKELNYIGKSKNAYDRINVHKNLLKKLFTDEPTKRLTTHKTSRNKIDFKKHLLESIKTHNLDSTYAFYQKIWMKMIEHNLTLANLFVELIWNQKTNNDIEAKEQELIALFDSEWNGFNGMFTYEFQYLNMLRNSNLSDEIKKQLMMKVVAKNAKNINLIKQKMQKNEIGMEWLYYTIKARRLNVELSREHMEIYPNYCQKIISLLADSVA